jgi:hypothetical protein
MALPIPPVTIDSAGQAFGMTDSCLTHRLRASGADKPMTGTVLMLFFGLPSIMRSLQAT